MKKVFLSLLLAFSLIPMIPLNTASATETFDIPLGEVEIPSKIKKDLGIECIIKANSGAFSVESQSTNPLFYASAFDSFRNEYGLGGREKVATVPFNYLVPGRQTSLTFAIQNLAETSDVFNSTLSVELDTNGCYKCIGPDGVIASYGDCSADNDNQPNGVSRILAPIAALLGGLLLLF